MKNAAAAASMLAALTLISACTCGKKETQAPAEPPPTEVAKEAEVAPEPAAAEPAETEEAETEEAKTEAEEAAPPPKAPTEATRAALAAGTASQNLLAIMAATVLKLQLAADADEAAKILNDTLNDYDVTGLREQARADKEAGRGASSSTKREFASQKMKYETLQKKFAAENSAEFDQAARQWAKVWGLN